MAKHTHILSVNTLKKRVHSFTYSFGNTKDITIAIAKNHFSITARLNKMYDKSDMLTKNGYLFPDAIKKAMLLHLLLYSKNILVKSITVQIDDNMETIQNKTPSSPPIVYSLIDGGLYNSIATKWTDAEIASLLSQPKSKYDSRMSSLYAFICSKSKLFEVERFMYLWMSFNGLYNYFSSIVSATHENKKIKRENVQLRYFQRLFDWGDETLTDDKEKHRLANGVNAIIRRMPSPATIAAFADPASPLANGIDKLLKNPETSEKHHLTSLGYFITQYAYYYRCKLFHADMPVVLFSFADENEIKCLKSINNVLEEFIDLNLHLWFDSSYVDKNLYPKAANMELI